MKNIFGALSSTGGNSWAGAPSRDFMVTAMLVFGFVGFMGARARVSITQKIYSRLWARGPRPKIWRAEWQRASGQQGRHVPSPGLVRLFQRPSGCFRRPSSSLAVRLLSFGRSFVRSVARLPVNPRSSERPSERSGKLQASDRASGPANERASYSRATNDDQC